MRRRREEEAEGGGGGEKEIGGYNGDRGEMLKVNVKYIMVTLVLPPVGDEEQGQVVE